MKHFIRPTEYHFLETLAIDVVTGSVSDRYLSLTFDVEPIPISEAPMDIPLVVVSNELTIQSTSMDSPLARTLLMGSVITKLSKESVLLTEDINDDSYRAMFYSEVSYFRALHAGEHAHVNELKSYHGELSLSNTDAYVVPVTAIRSYGAPLFGKLPVVTTEDLVPELVTS